jgi:glycerophosphoryl diester phosphodiesterase
MPKLIIKKMPQVVLLSISLLLAVSPHAEAQNSVRETNKNYLNFSTTAELQQFYTYNAKDKIIISGHRGGIDFPENSLEGLQEERYAGLFRN